MPIHPISSISSLPLEPATATAKYPNIKWIQSRMMTLMFIEDYSLSHEEFNAVGGVQLNIFLGSCWPSLRLSSKGMLFMMYVFSIQILTTSLQVFLELLHTASPNRPSLKPSGTSYGHQPSLPLSSHPSSLMGSMAFRILCDCMLLRDPLSWRFTNKYLGTKRGGHLENIRVQLSLS